MAGRTRILVAAALSGVLAVLLGAFAAHSMPLSVQHADWMETASRYHFYHTLALLALPAVMPAGRARAWVAGLWLAGMLLFSGSLYLAAMAGLEWFWITPVGGVLLIGGWAVLGWSLIAHETSS